MGRFKNTKEVSEWIKGLAGDQPERKNAGNTVAYRVEFTIISGDLNAGILLSQLSYWATISPDDFCFQTIKQLEQETGLSVKQQRLAREKLADKSFVSFKLEGWRTDTRIGSRYRYIINYDAIQKALEDLYNGSTTVALSDTVYNRHRPKQTPSEK